MELLELHPSRDADDIVKGLRNIADQIESGDYPFNPDTIIVVTALQSSRRMIGAERFTAEFETHSLGVHSGFYETKGILAAALNY